MNISPLTYRIASFSFIKFKANAAAEALRTEKSSTPFIPIEKAIDSANSSKRNPLNLANSSVLNPMIKHIAKIISAAVTIVPTMEIIDSGNHGFIIWVYSRKLFQSPQTETSSLQIPNLSATADKKEAASANRRKILIILLSILFLF